MTSAWGYTQLKSFNQSLLYSVNIGNSSRNNTHIYLQQNKELKQSFFNHMKEMNVESYTSYKFNTVAGDLLLKCASELILAAIIVRKQNLGI